MARKPKSKPAKPNTEVDQLHQFEKASDTFRVLEMMAAQTAQSRGYVIVSLPAAHTQGLETNRK